MRGGIAFACAVVMLSAPAARGQSLRVGDAAPGLAGGEWVKGEAVAPEKGGQVCVIEFWATWCPPCKISLPALGALQDEYAAKGLVCVAVSDEPAGVVRPYVKELGERASFRVVAAPGGSINRSYLSAAGVRGIPYAFVVGHNGRIVWHGHPLDELDVVVKSVLDGKEIEPRGAMKSEPKRPSSDGNTTDRHLEALRDAIDREDIDEALQLVDKLLAPNPNDRFFIDLKLQLLIKGKRDQAAAFEYGRQVVDANRSDPSILNELSWRFLTISDYGLRCPELAMYAAQVAQEASGGKRADIADTYARALYQAGLLDEALKVQADAVRLARESGGSAEMLSELESVLAYYEACRAARALAQRVE